MGFSGKSGDSGGIGAGGAMTPEESAFQQGLQDAVTMRMPFGKYGPQFYPPQGLALCDLPFEYLDWFRRKGMPGGRLGEIMGLVLQIKRDGIEDVFDALRGGMARPCLRRRRVVQVRLEEG